MAEIKFEAKLIRNPFKQKSDNWQETAHQWLITINGQTFDYYTGIAHLNKTWSIRSSRFTFEEFLRINRPTPPTLDDVLYSLVSDAEAGEMTFAQWCGELGYDEDSRNALTTYELCQKTADKLKRAGIDIAAERERLADC